MVKYNWKNLLEITFTTAQLTNKAFKLFADNYEKYPNIKILYLCNVFITFQLITPVSPLWLSTCWRNSKSWNISILVIKVLLVIFRKHMLPKQIKYCWNIKVLGYVSRCWCFLLQETWTNNWWPIKEMILLFYLKPIKNKRKLSIVFVLYSFNIQMIVSLLISLFFSS